MCLIWVLFFFFFSRFAIMLVLISSSSPFAFFPFCAASTCSAAVKITLA